MPETSLIRDFSAGWTPSDDAINGRPNGLLQMDNLELDRNGALTLTGGTVVKRTLSSNAHTLYSRFLNGTRHDYAATVDGHLYRDTTSIGTGGDATNGAFGTAFDFVLACSGSTKLKDNGSTAVNLGIVPPGTSPGVVVNSHNSPIATIGQINSNFVAVTGTAIWVASPGYLSLVTDSTTGTVVVQSFNSTGAPYNDNSLTSVAGTGIGTDDDFVIINFGVLPNNVSLQLDVLLSAGNSSGDQVNDFYTFKVDDITQLDSYGSFFGSLKIKRSQFMRVGNGGQDWSTVYGYRLTITASPGVGLGVTFWGSYYGFTILNFQGSNIAQFGIYDYVQINVNNMGSYIAKSIIGPIVSNITIDGACALITPRNPTLDDSQCNEAWIFRRSSNGSGLLGQWYRVLVFTAGGGWAAAYDNFGDLLALTLNITINLNLISIASIGKIFDIIGPIEGRWYYFTANFMYPSDISDPDLVDASIAIRTCGSNSEMFMWARAISASVVLVGTNCEVYLLTGTFATLPDNSVDIYYQGLGVRFPPITYDAISYGGAVYYLASDGWRMCMATSFGTTYSSQNNQLLVTPNTDRLYRGETCYGYSAPNLSFASGTTRFPVTIVRNKLWCFITGTNRVEVWDFLRQYWRPIQYGLGDASAVCSTQDGTVLAHYTSDNKQREVCSLSSKLIDGTTKQTINLLGHVVDNGQPRQRKDTYTFKTRAYTSSSGQLALSVNGTSVGNVPVSVSTSTEQFLDLSTVSAIQLVKTYQITLTGQFNDLIIDDFSIDYDARPIPTTFLRVIGLNYNTTARKRVYTIPFQIDTLGNDVLVSPLVDGTAQTPLIVNSTRKQSFDYQFLVGGSDILIGTDYEWLINGQGKEFEWYGFQELRNIEVLPERRRAHVIPVTNFGTTARKRLRVRRFVMDCLSTTVTFTPVIDGVLQASQNYNGSKKTYYYYYTSDQIGVDFSGIFSAPGPFELFEVLEPQEGDIEVFPERVEYFIIPVTNFNSPVKKRVRGWPFILNTLGNPINWTPIVDGSNLSTIVFNIPDKSTVRAFYKTDVFGIDYSGIFSAPTPFEIWGILEPDVVQALPPARQFDQVGPQEFLRFGKIVKIEVRLISFGGTKLPFNIYFSDSSKLTGNFAVLDSQEDSYYLDVPKGISGRILRVELGPTSFNFHRYYMRFLCAPSGGQENTELEWITVPNGVV